MPQFYFHLRACGMIHRDTDGTEVVDVAAAHEHASAVARELMQHSGGATRCWSIRIDDHNGEQRLDVYFADVDQNLASYPAQMRTLIGETCRRLGALTDALAAARVTRLETRMLLARARGKPQLVYARGK